MPPRFDWNNPLLAPIPVGTLLIVVVASVGTGTAACDTELQGELRLEYESVRVTEAPGDVLIDGEGPGGYYTAYEIQPEYPLSIESTAYLEENQKTGRAQDDGDDKEGDADEDWERVDVSAGRLTVAPDSDCEVTSAPSCDGETCTFALEVPGDGVCVASLTLETPDTRIATHCWGFGWDDGRGQSPEQREQLTDSMIRQRDEYCDG